MGRLTTHVLDTAHGRPAEGVRIELHRLDSGARAALGAATTNADGRVDGALLEGAAFTLGVYELSFHAGAYFAAQGAPSFLGVVPVRFEIQEAGGHYHVPLLLSPYGYSTYRGS